MSIVPPYKIIMIGDSGTGKTSIVYRFTNNAPLNNTEPTIGASLIKKVMEVETSNGIKYLDVNIWDTAGQEKFQCLIPLYLRNASAAIIVADVTREENECIYNLDKYYESVRSDSNNADNIIILFAINKIDLEYKDSIKSKYEEWASKVNIPCYSVSAKTGVGISELFEEIATKIVDNCVSEPETQFFNLQEETKTQKSCC